MKMNELRAFLATHLPEASAEQHIFEGDARESLINPFYPDEGRMIDVTLPVATNFEGIYPGALRRAGVESLAMQVGKVSVSIAIPAAASHVAGWRHRAAFAWSRQQASAIGAGEFEAIVAKLKASRELAEAKNLDIAARARAHPASQRAAAQQARERSIQESLPTDDVDAWIVVHLGYSYDEIEGWSASTRRPRRRIARTIMSLPVDASRAQVDAILAKCGSAAEWTNRVRSALTRATMRVVE